VIHAVFIDRDFSDELVAFGVLQLDFVVVVDDEEGVGQRFVGCDFDFGNGAFDARRSPPGSSVVSGSPDHDGSDT